MFLKKMSKDFNILLFKAKFLHIRMPTFIRTYYLLFAIFLYSYLKFRRSFWHLLISEPILKIFISTFLYSQMNIRHFLYSHLKSRRSFSHVLIKTPSLKIAFHTYLYSQLTLFAHKPDLICA